MKNLYGSAIYCYQNEAFYFSLYLRSYQSTNTIIIICALAYSTMIVRHIHVIIYYHRLAQRCVKQLTTVYAWTSRNQCHQHIRSKTVFRFFCTLEQFDLVATAASLVADQHSTLCVARALSNLMHFPNWVDTKLKYCADMQSRERQIEL